MPVALSRSPLGSSLEPVDMLRVFRGTDGLFGLIGAWHGSRTVIGFDPAQRLPAGADPFAVLVGGAVDDDATAGFGGGWVGAFGYQLGRRLETLPPPPHRPTPLSDASLAYYDHVLVRDGAGWWFEALVDDNNRDRLAAQHAEIRRVVEQADQRPMPHACTDFVATPDAAGHRVAVATALRHLAAGDIFQANVCRRFEAEFSGDPLDAFCAGVEQLAPAYGAFLTTAEGAIASLSPELFLRRTGRQVRTSPIKGTAPLDTDIEDLVGSAKDRAENVMIVDLMRNDLGRVCVPGSVRVEDIARAEQRAGVWHLVSDVVGTLTPGLDDGTLLRATFPPGSVTGAPKVRAMEVIHEVESTGRETYTGAIGFASPAAGLELSVAIRTFEFADEQVWFGAGGGVVIDSTPEGERVETLVKAKPLVQAIGGRLSPAEEVVDLSQVLEVGRPAGSHAQIPTLQPAVDLAQGVFTTCLVVDGRPVDLNAHLTRLAASVWDCYAVSLTDDLGDQVSRRAAELRGRHRLRVAVLPSHEGLYDSVITAARLEPGPRQSLRAVPVVVPGGLGPHKYGDRSRLQAAEPSAGTWTSRCDALVTDRDGSVLETGRGNLFIVTDNAVLTPALDGRILPGVTRQRAIEELEARGITVLERRLSLADVARATEVFVTSSVDRVRAVASVDGVGIWDDGATTEWLAHRLAADPLPRCPAAARVATRPASKGMTLLLIDNYDSFVYNLDQYVRELGARTRVVRNDAVSVDEILCAAQAGDVQGVVISPGPGTPADAGISTEVVRRLASAVPILGVCLGHQCIAAAYGAHVMRTETVVHGKASLVHHDGRGLFAALDGPLIAGRYHSLVVSERGLPAELVVTARTGSGVVMGLRHREHHVEGVQFHPESILSRDGHQLLGTFMDTCLAVRSHRDLRAGRAWAGSTP